MIRRLINRVVQCTAAGFKKDHRLVRHYMYTRFQERDFVPKGLEKVLSISSSGRMIEALGYDPETATDADYPDYDLLGLPFEDEAFDLVVADQVMEHVQGDPYQAMKESFRVVKKGGYVVHATCFLNPHHCLPNDYWRVSKYGLAELVGDSGEIVELDCWGNFGALTLIYLGARSLKIPKARWHPLNWIANTNNTEWPITTWAIARK